MVLLTRLVCGASECTNLNGVLSRVSLGVSVSRGSFEGASILLIVNTPLSQARR